MAWIHGVLEVPKTEGEAWRWYTFGDREPDTLAHDMSWAQAISELGDRGFELVQVQDWVSEVDYYFKKRIG